jgi:class 3 adenylate cyclase
LPIGIRRYATDRQRVLRARLCEQWPDRERLSGVRDAEVRYAEWGNESIAYQVFGSGPRDLLFYQAWCPIDLMWELPQLASFMETLGRMARVTAFDPLGTGASDPIADSRAASLEALSDQVVAVMNAVRADRVVLFDTTGTSGVPLAATYPQHIQALILVNLRPSFPELRSMSRDDRVKLVKAMTGVRSLVLHNPRVAHDPALRQWWGRARRLLTSPKQAFTQVEVGARVDIEAVLSTVRVPTLVLHRRDNPMFDIETSRRAASQIPNARFVELPGSESDLFLGETAPVLGEIEQFLAESGVDTVPDRPLATVLFTDMVSSTEQLAERGDDAWRQFLDDHDRTMNQIVTKYRGRVVKTTGDGILATFDGPARAVRCAAALRDAAHDQGITLRAGLHTGEIELRSSDIAGIAVHAASRIAALAGPNEILVSRTVVDLTAGSGLDLQPRGEHQLKGVPGSWPLFDVHVADAEP